MANPIIWFGQYGKVLAPLGLVDINGNPIGGASVTFAIIQPITGSTPTANLPNDTLTNASDGSIGCLGSSVAKSLTWSVNAGYGKRLVTGTTASPTLVTNASAIAVSAVPRQLIRVAGNGGPVSATIADGTIDGQELEFEGCHTTNSVTVTGPGLTGDLVLILGSMGRLSWNLGSAKWTEAGRNYV